MDGGDLLSVAGVIAAALIAGYFAQGGASALRRRAIREELDLADRLGRDTSVGEALAESAKRRGERYVATKAPLPTPDDRPLVKGKLANAIDAFYWGSVSIVLIASTINYVLR